MKKPNLNALRRPLIGFGVVALAVSGVAVTNLATRPASTSGPATVQLAQPVGVDEETSTTTTAPTVDGQAVLEAAGRAENAAGRAEGSATRAEVAATKVEAIAAASTTTTMATMAAPVSGPTTAPTTTEVSQPTATTAPKTWVEVGRFHGPMDGTNRFTEVVLETGMLRVWSVVPNGYHVPGVAGEVWFGPEPVQACPPTAENTGTIILAGRYDSPGDCPSWAGPWPTGPQTIGTNVEATPGWSSNDVIIEEYR